MDQVQICLKPVHMVLALLSWAIGVAIHAIAATLLFILMLAQLQPVLVCIHYQGVTPFTCNAGIA